jgi:hypothetical protein
MAHDHSNHQEHLGVLHGDHLEGPHLEGTILYVIQVDMGPQYYMYIDFVIA